MERGAIEGLSSLFRETPRQAAARKERASVRETAWDNILGQLRVGNSWDFAVRSGMTHFPDLATGELHDAQEPNMGLLALALLPSYPLGAIAAMRGLKEGVVDAASGMIHAANVRKKARERVAKATRQRAARMNQ